MSEWYMVCDAATGAAVSIGTEVASPLRETLAAVPLSDEDATAILSSTGRWDEATRSVVIVPPPIPDVTPWQIRTWLAGHGVDLGQIDTLIEALPASVRTQARIDWDWGSVVRRSHPLIESLGESLGLTPWQIDAAFREAAGYE